MDLPSYQGESHITQSKTQTFGALAFGVDFYDRFKLPFRLEIEITTHSDNKTESKPNFIEVPGYYNGINPDFTSKFGFSRATTLMTNMFSTFINLYIDWHNKTNFIPYGGAGIGYSFIRTRFITTGGYWSLNAFDHFENAQFSTGNLTEEHETFRKSKSKSWHLDLGIMYSLTLNTKIDLSYRYINYGKAVDTKETVTKTYIVDITRGPSSTLTLSGPDKIQYKPSHQLNVGFQYLFI
jgi:opacity protein-like surface antigen